MARFFLEDQDYLERIVAPNYEVAGKPSSFGTFASVILAVNRLWWRAALAAAVVMLVWPWRLSGRGVWLGLLYRVSFCCVAAQPMLSFSNGRYYILIVPIVAASVGIASGAAVLDEPASDAESSQSWVRWLQWGLPTTIVAMASLILIPF